MQDAQSQKAEENKEQKPIEEPIDWNLKVWQALEGDKKNGVHQDVLRAFTGAIMKIMITEPVTGGNVGKYGTYTEDGKYSLNQQQATRVHKDFILLYLNRTAYGSNQVKNTEEIECTFKPSLCELSVSIVSSKKATNPNKNDSSKPGNHVEKLLQDKEKLEAKLRKKKEAYEKSQKEECTFKPKITEYVPDTTVEPPKKTAKHIKVSTAKTTGNRWDSLYDLSKKIPKKDDKSSNDYAYEKQKAECTFAPNINKEKIEPKENANDPLIGETIERLKKGREERERIKKGTERCVDDSGMRFDIESSKFKKGSGKEYSKQMSSRSSGDEKKDSGKKERNVEKLDNISPEAQNQAPKPPENEAPLSEEQKADEKLYIDVNLGENVERIIVRKGDTAEGLAAKFAEEHGLSEAVRQKLEVLIQDQMKSLLDNIEEEAEIDPNKSSP